MAQSYYKLYYHIVWGTKKRLPLITPEIELLINKYLFKKIIEYEGQQLALNMVEDHIHLLVSIPPKISIAEFVHNIKGSTTYYINTNQGEQGFYWQAGYGVLSLSERGIPFVKEYIAKQKRRHANKNLINVLEYIPKEDNIKK